MDTPKTNKTVEKQTMKGIANKFAIEDFDNNMDPFEYIKMVEERKAKEKEEKQTQKKKEKQTQKKKEFQEKIIEKKKAQKKGLFNANSKNKFSFLNYIDIINETIFNIN